jgi:WXG100 family type VII secretion target
MVAVDLDLLAETVAAMRHCGAALDARLAEVAAQVGALQATWTGDAAEAQAAAQAAWEAGLQTMCDGLAGMRAAGELAGDNYHAAVDTNLAMWGQMS